jgi:RNA polymerase sigma factor (sigma-70 family)
MMSQARDEQWLAEVFDAHAGDVHRYARRRLQGAPDPQSDADDVVAEVFAITWRRRDAVSDPVLAWLYGVARRVVASHQRRVVPLPIAEQPGDEPGPDSRYQTDIAEWVSEDLSLQQAWSSLSQRDREVLLLAAWEGLGEAQIATVLDVSVGGASAALSRARTRLRQALAESDDASS